MIGFWEFVAHRCPAAAELHRSANEGPMGARNATGPALPPEPATDFRPERDCDGLRDRLALDLGSATDGTGGAWP